MDANSFNAAPNDLKPIYMIQNRVWVEASFRITDRTSKIGVLDTVDMVSHLEVGNKDRQGYLAERLATPVPGPKDPPSKAVPNVSTYCKSEAEKKKDPSHVSNYRCRCDLRKVKNQAR